MKNAEDFSLLKLVNAVGFLEGECGYLSDCWESRTIPSEDKLALVNATINEINEHWQEFVHRHNLEREAGFEDEVDFESGYARLVNESDKLPKYLMYKNDEFVPVIYKHEWDSNYRAYWAMYARRTNFGFSTRKVLFAVSGTSLGNVLGKFYTRFDELCIDKKIQDKNWLGSEPIAIDFWNDQL